MTDFKDENRKMLQLSWNFNHSFLSLFQEFITLGNFLLSPVLRNRAILPSSGSGSLIHGSGSGSYPQILSYFFDKNSCQLPWFLFLSRRLHACVGQCPVRVDLHSLVFFVQQEPEPEPEPRATKRFRFFLGQNDTVPVVPVPVQAPVPQHCLSHTVKKLTHRIEIFCWLCYCITLSHYKSTKTRRKSDFLPLKNFLKNFL
jgi:hypothetical protein